MTKIIILILIFCSFPLLSQIPEQSVPFKSDQILTINNRSTCRLKIIGHNENTIKYKISGDLSLNNDFLKFFEDTPGSYSIQIPKNISTLKQLDFFIPSRTKLLINQFKGDIHVSNFDKTIEIKAGSSNIFLKSLRSETQILKIYTNKGNIILADSQVNSYLSTDQGNINVKNVVGNPIIKSKGGDVIFRAVNPVGQIIFIRNMGGKVDVSSSPAGADIVNAGGNIRIGNARNFVTAKTMGGDIIILSLKGSIKAKTSGGDIKVRVKDSLKYPIKNIDLSSLSGEIVLTLPDFFSMKYKAEIKTFNNQPTKYKIFNAFKTVTQSQSPITGSRVASGSCFGGKNLVILSTSFGNIFLKKLVLKPYTQTKD